VYSRLYSVQVLIAPVNDGMGKIWKKTGGDKSEKFAAIRLEMLMKTTKEGEPASRGNLKGLCFECTC